MKSASCTFSLTLRSNNRKLGPCAVASGPRSTCPTSCPFRNDGGCYGEGYPINTHWNRVDRRERGYEWPEFCERVSDLPRRPPWRYGDVGDLPGRGDRVSRPKVAELVAANDRRRGFAYSHYPVLASRWATHNHMVLQRAIEGGLTVNLSAEGLSKADALYKLGFPVVTVLPRSLGDWRKLVTPAGVTVLRCPAERGSVQCINCGGSGGPLCARPYRPYIVGLTAHGSRARTVEAVIEHTEAMWS